MNHEDIEAARLDYGKWEKCYGFEIGEALKMSRQKSTQITDDGLEKHFQKRPSKIADDGLFSLKAIQNATFLGFSRMSGLRTQLGSLVNHSDDPNCMFVRDLISDDILTISIRDIAAGEEITVSYWQAGKVNGWPIPENVPF